MGESHNYICCITLTMNCDQKLAKVIPKSPWKSQGSSEELSHEYYESRECTGPMQRISGSAPLFIPPLTEL